MEDGFGVVQLVNAKEYKINDADEFLSLIEKGAKMRRTEETEKNHTSSRSHALCRIRVNNTKVKEMEDGVLFMVDLAGSEVSFFISTIRYILLISILGKCRYKAP